MDFRKEFGKRNFAVVRNCLAVADRTQQAVAGCRTDWADHPLRAVHNAAEEGLDGKEGHTDFVHTSGEADEMESAGEIDLDHQACETRAGTDSS